MSTECVIYDLGGMPIKHWKLHCYGELIYIPVPIRGSIEGLFESFRTFVPREKDVWICGHPKSGNHWTFEIVQMLLRGDGKLYNRMFEKYFVEIRSSLNEFNTVESPRVFATHLPYTRLPVNVKKNCKIIVIMRNPKSTAVSYYHHMRNAIHTKYEGEFNDFWPLYIKGITEGFLFKDWFSFNEEYWQAACDTSNVLILFYEEMTKDLGKCLRRLCNFLNLERSPSFLQEVITLTTLKTLKGSWSKKHADDLKMTSKMDSSLIYRKGEIDEWKSHFSKEDNDKFDLIYHKRMKHPELLKRIKFE